MKLNFKRKKNIKKFVSLFVCCLLLLGAIMGTVVISKHFKDEYKTIHPSFSVGTLDDLGKYKESSASIYTKDVFECKGLEVKLDFDSNVKYQAFFYDELEEYVSKSDVYTASNKFIVPNGVTYARLVVYPVWNSNVAKEDRVCHWYDTYKYSSQIEVIVLKEQGLGNGDIIDKISFTAVGFKRNSTYTMEADAVTASNYVTTSEAIDIKEVNEIRVYLPAGASMSVIFYDSQGRSMMQEEYVITAIQGELTESLDIPFYAEYAHFNFCLDNVSSVDDFAVYLR